MTRPGASIGNALAGYGTDMYVREYEAELGVPWKNLDVYLRNSKAPVSSPVRPARALTVARPPAS